ncbi:DUF1214 domain-containing protein [Kitasatospora griseola]|uniref:DUF1214 domain-containing protein n=1 Tax=Kitasatospora griseola TaxID=2064 RepID=UPI003803B6FE
MLPGPRGPPSVLAAHCHTCLPNHPGPRTRPVGPVPSITPETGPARPRPRRGAEGAGYPTANSARTAFPPCPAVAPHSVVSRSRTTVPKPWGAPGPATSAAACPGHCPPAARCPAPASPSARAPAPGGPGSRPPRPHRLARPHLGVGQPAPGERHLRTRRLPRRRGQGPLVRPGRHRLTRDVPPRRRSGLGLLARPARRHRQLPRRRPQLPPHRYDARTRSEVDAPQGRAALRSLFDKLGPDGADSVDLYFGPTEPDGADGRWVQTLPGCGWFTHFRIYGPQQAAFDGTWKPGDLEPLTP